MATRAYLGIPRSMIPWAPHIDEEKCIGCGDCLETCANGVFVLDEEAGQMQVAAPDNCVVLCDKCAALCNEDAITFPDEAETRGLKGQPAILLLQPVRPRYHRANLAGVAERV